MCWDHAIALSGIQKSLSPSQNIHYFGILKGEGESVHVHTHTPTFFKHRKPKNMFTAAALEFSFPSTL